MNLAIKTEKLEDGSWLASVDWSKGDAGNAGTPGTIRYGDTEDEARTRLKDRLIEKGHNIIN